MFDTSSITFFQWLGLQRKYLFVSAVVILLQFIFFKYLYPFPNFFPDSYVYIEAAINNKNIAMWPIGYSKFLWLFSVITRTHQALVFFQYILLQAAVLYFLFTIGYLLKPGKWLFRILLAAAVLNPLLLYISNFVSSDALFAALSLVWFTQVLWILYRPGWLLLMLHVLVLSLAFTVRYNAMYYPFVSTIVIILTSMSPWKKRVTILLSFLVLGAFMGFTQSYYQKETGYIQFAPFAGWQLASNALFAYAQVPAGERIKEEVPMKFIDLQVIADRHIDSLQQLSVRPDASLGAYYLWNEKAPLKKYMHTVWANDSKTSGFNHWVWMGPTYQQYGYYLIRHYPQAYAKHYILPNLINYYVPPPEFLVMYNMNRDTVKQQAVAWFKLKNNKVYNNVAGRDLQFIYYYPIILALINLLFVLSFIGAFLLNTFYNNKVIKSILACFLLVWFCNMGFSVLASPIVLRYQLFPMLITQTAMLWLVICLIQKYFRNTTDSYSKDGSNNRVVVDPVGYLNMK